MAFDFGTASVRVKAVLDGFRADVIKEATAAGEAGGKAATAGVNKQFSLGSTLAKGFGTAVAGAFGIAAVRGIELEKVTARVRAETGLVGEEAEKAGRAINRMSGTNMQGLEEIGSTLSKVHTDLGLTGDAAEAATQQFLTFARATGQEASSAVAAFDDILDGFNLDADKGAGIMDQLVVSHQKFGGSITANQSALAAMAPALQAMNLGVDDGIEILNLFAESGIAASDAAGLLRLAVKNLKPGQDLNDLIAQLGAIEDPTLRAQKAIELFGRSGAKIANAIKPGTTSLDEYGVSAEESVGASENARKALDDTFGAKAQLLLHQFGSTVSDVLGKNGPMFTALASIGSLAGTFGLDKLFKKIATSAPVKGAAHAAGLAIGAVFSAAMAGAETLITTVSSALGKLPGASAVRGAASSAGTFLGTTMGKAFSVAFAVAAVAGAVLAFIDLQEQVKKQGGDLATQTADWVKIATLEQLKQARAGVQKERDKLSSDPLGTFFGISATPAVDKTLAQLDEAIAQYDAKVRGATPRVQADIAALFGLNIVPIDSAFWTDLIPPVEPLHAQAFNLGVGIADGVVEALGKLPPEAKRITADALQKMADGIDAARQLPLDAFDRLLEAMKTPLTQTAETARLIGELASKDLAAGLASGDPAIRAQARATKEAILERLEEIKPRAGTVSKEAMAELVAGMKSKDADIAQAATAIYNTVTGGIAPLPGKAKGIGRATTIDFGGGLSAGITEKVSPVINTGVKKVGELDLSDKSRGWGAEIIAEFAAGIASGAGALATGVETVLAPVRRAMEAHSPPKEGPLKDIAIWAKNTGLAWVDEFVASLGTAPEKVKSALGWVKAEFDKFVANYNPIGNLLGGLTPEADRANLEQYIASLRAKLPGVTDPEERNRILHQILEYQERLAALQGQVATESQKTAQTLQGYINNLDEALLRTTDPARIKKITDQLLIYLARLDAILHPKVPGGAAAASAEATPEYGSFDEAFTQGGYAAGQQWMANHPAAMPTVAPSPSAAAVSPGPTTTTGPDPRLQGTNGYIDENGTLIVGPKGPTIAPAPTTIIVNNPSPEPATRSVADALRLQSAFG